MGIVGTGCTVAITLLKTIHASADAFPPLKAVAGGTLYILETVQKFKKDKEEWRAFGQYTCEVVATLVPHLSRSNLRQAELRQGVAALRQKVEAIQQTVDDLQAGRSLRRYLNFANDPERITGMKNELRDAINIFGLGIALTQATDSAKILEVLEEHSFQKVVQDANAKLVERIATATNLNSLHYIEDAAWNEKKVCLEGTRTLLIDELMDWVRFSDGKKADIYWLADVAGSGKSAIAHTIAERCDEDGILASSFFFDRTAGRTSPRALIWTLARDIAQLNDGVADEISLALQADHGIASAKSIGHMFDKLIVGPASCCVIFRPAIIVIDALDEGCSDELLSILRNDVPKLPPVFRFIITSRPDPTLAAGLVPVQPCSINIHGEPNQADIAAYLDFRLKAIVSKNLKLDRQWPTADLLYRLRTMAGGLFLWASTVCDYLAEMIRPDKKLAALLDSLSTYPLPPIKKMDDLYSKILGSCRWDDDDFVEGYGLVVGTVMVARTPLTTAGLQALLESDADVSVKAILHPLASLFTGVSNETQPVRALHLSFRDFLTRRAKDIDGAQRYFIDEQHHHQNVARRCLRVLDAVLSTEIPGLGYLGECIVPYSSPGLPEPLYSEITETGWYAIDFWMEHVVQIMASVESTFVEILQNFLQLRFISWMEIRAPRNADFPLLHFRNWLQVALPEYRTLWDLFSRPEVTKVAYKLSVRLLSLEFATEALMLVEYVVSVCRSYKTGDPATYSLSLAQALRTLSHCQSTLGLIDEPLAAAEESVDILRGLPRAERQSANSHFQTISLDDSWKILEESETRSRGQDITNSSTVRSFITLSHSLSRVGRPEHALTAAQEAVELLRGLITGNACVPESHLIISLLRLSNCQSSLGQKEEAVYTAIEAIHVYSKAFGIYEGNTGWVMDSHAEALTNLAGRFRESGRHDEALEADTKAVKLRRTLAADRPAVFNKDLASSLLHLGADFYKLGRHDEALDSRSEAVKLCRSLAADRPAVFNKYLASSLLRVGNDFYKLDRQDEALESRSEAVKLFRTLAADRPAVFNKDLASALLHLGTDFYKLGRHDEALDSRSEAVKLYRTLAADRPAVFNKDLASALLHLGADLYKLGRHDEALDSRSEAVKLYRTLAADRPAVFNKDLASSLLKVGIDLYKVGRRDEALDARSEAVKLYRTLAAGSPAIFTEALASSLLKVGFDLYEVGRHDEALNTDTEAVKLYRTLAADRPAVFTEVLASSLLSVGEDFYELGRHDEALDSHNEAVQIYRTLTADCPAVFNKDLALALLHLGGDFHKLGRHDEALDSRSEAVKLYRTLVTDRPAVFNKDLASALLHLGADLYKLGRHDEALDPHNEALKLYRTLAADYPAVFNKDLASSLLHLGADLYKLGRHDEALDSRSEAVKLYRTLAADHPTVFTKALASSLLKVGVDLYELGRHDEALNTDTEAVKMYRTLAADRPAVFTEVLASSLLSVGEDFYELGRHDEALDSHNEAVKLFRTLAADCPAVFNKDLASSLLHLGVDFYELGRHKEALDSHSEAVKLYRLLAADCPAIFTEDLASSLLEVGEDFCQLGRHDEALDSRIEAVRLYRTLAAERPANFTEDLASSLLEVGEDFSQLGRHNEALAACGEAVKLYRTLAAANPAVFNEDLASSLQQAVGRILGWQDDAGTVSSEADTLLYNVDT